MTTTRSTPLLDGPPFTSSSTHPTHDEEAQPEQVALLRPTSSRLPSLVRQIGLLRWRDLYLLALPLAMFLLAVILGSAVSVSEPEIWPEPVAFFDTANYSCSIILLAVTLVPIQYLARLKRVADVCELVGTDKPWTNTEVEHAVRLARASLPDVLQGCVLAGSLLCVFVAYWGVSAASFQPRTTCRTRDRILSGRASAVRTANGHVSLHPPLVQVSSQNYATVSGALSFCVYLVFLLIVGLLYSWTCHMLSIAALRREKGRLPIAAQATARQLARLVLLQLVVALYIVFACAALPMVYTRPFNGTSSAAGTDTAKVYAGECARINATYLARHCELTAGDWSRSDWVSYGLGGRARLLLIASDGC